MKKIYTYLTLLAGASVLILSSCTREVVPTEPEKENTPAKVRTEVVGVKTESDETKVTLTGSTFAWQDGDAIAVWTGTTNTSGSFQDCTVSEGKITVTLAEGESRKNYAVYPASVKDETYAGGTLYVKLPASYAHTDLLGTKTPLPMVANNTESSLTFYNVAGLLRITVKAIPNTATGLVFQFPGNKVSGTFAVDNPGTGTSSIATGTPGSGEDKITVTFPANTAEEMTLNIPLPTGAYDDVFVTPIGSTTKVAAVRHIKAGGYTAARARGKQLTATLVSFSIDTDRQIVFAPANLVATIGADYASTEWNFHAHQHDMVITSSSQKQSFSVGSKIDTFGFVGEGGSASGKAEWGISSAGTGSTYSGESVPDPLKHDWGESVIGHYAANFWFTPSIGEWEYVIRTRSTVAIIGGVSTSDVRFAKAKLFNDGEGGVQGIIIFPDNYVHPTGLAAPASINVENVASKTIGNNYNESEWAQMEDAGAIFLPSAGYRSGTTMNNVNSYIDASVGDALRYRTRSHIETRNDTAYRFLVNNTNINFASETVSRATGMSVRLVREL